jgi:hypothetical protein
MAMTPTGWYRFAHFWASVMVGLGLAFMVIGLVSAGLLLLLPAELPIPSPWSRPSAGVAVVGGLIVAAALTLAGQLVQIFLDQRRLLGHILRRLRRWEDERESERSHPCEAPATRVARPARSRVPASPHRADRGRILPDHDFLKI